MPRKESKKSAHARAARGARGARGTRRTLSTRTTRRIRVKLDYVVRYDRQLDGLGEFVGPDGVMELILGGLRAVLLPRERGRVIDVMPGARMSASLDFRKHGAAG